MTATTPMDPCLLAGELAESPEHRGILCFKIITCFCGVIGDIWIWTHEGTRWIGHPNARLIYGLHLFWATVVSVTYSCPIIFDLIRFLIPRDSDCEYLVPVSVSFWIRFLPAYAINAQAFAMCALAIERFIATLIPKRYEKIKKPYLGIFFCLLAVILPAIQLAVLIVWPNKWMGSVVATSILTTDNTESYTVHLLFQRILEITNISLFSLTFYINKIHSWKVLNTRVSTLDLRYQIKETSIIVNSLLPCFIVHFVIFFAPPNILAWRRNTEPPLSSVDNYRWIEFTSEFQMYSLLMPAIIYIIRRREKNKAVVDQHQGIDNYFNRFNGWISCGVSCMAECLCFMVTLLVIPLSYGYQGYHDSNHLLFDLLNGSEQLSTAAMPTYPEGYEPNEIELPEHYQIAHYILDRYNKGYIPKRLGDGAIKVNFSMELYQIIQINEPQQYMLLNAWIAERWVDNLLGWDPKDFSNVSQIMVPFDKIWIPDTTLYNSLVMDDQNSRRLLSAKLTTLGRGQGAQVELLYPTIYKESCMLDLRFFPFDLQSCKLTFGSWTYDNTLIDYYPYKGLGVIGTSNCIENEGWRVLSTKVVRREVKYACCPNNYTLLELDLYVQRKPLYYVINLIAPTSIITFISIVGFFSSPSINDLRAEKITLGITTLLSMSILVFMVSDKMPSTSSFIPLIGWFYTSMILLISLGTVCSSLVIYVQKQGIIGHAPPPRIMSWAMAIARVIRLEKPLLMKQAYALKAKEEKIRKQLMGHRRRSLWHKVVDAAKEQAARKTSSSSAKLHGVNSSQRNSLEVPTHLSLKKKKSVRMDTSPKLEESISSEAGSNQNLPAMGNGGLRKLAMKALAQENKERADSADLNGTVNFAISDDDSTSFIDSPSSVPLAPRLPKTATSASLDSAILHSVNMMPPVKRDLAQLEYDWLAAVVERIFLILFTVVFMFMSVGINLVGFYLWMMAQDKAAAGGIPT